MPSCEVHVDLSFGVRCATVALKRKHHLHGDSGDDFPTTHSTIHVCIICQTPHTHASCNEAPEM